MSKVCVVTGSNKGIGYATVRKLCKDFDGIVYLTSRDESRGKEAVQNLKKEGVSPAYHQLDVNDESSIKRLAAYLKEKHGGLDVLVNNAGIAFKNDATDHVGVQAEHTVGTNYFGLLNVCKHLFPILKPHARVVNVASMAGKLSIGIKGKEPNASNLKKKLTSPTLTEEELNSIMQNFIDLAKQEKHQEAGYGSSTYCVSKVGVCALTRIQQRDFNGDPRPDLVVNSCCPGYVDTDMSSHKGHLTPDQGATNPSFLALLPSNIEEPKGAYYLHPKQLVDWTQT